MSLSLLHRCIILATESHAGQVDKAGEPYILHPLRVMCDSNLTTEIERCVAVLHDVIEDCPNVDLDRMLWIPEEIRWRIKLLSRWDHMEYFTYIRRICDSGDCITIRVKLADLGDNSKRQRSANITDLRVLVKLSRLRDKYQIAGSMLMATLNEIEEREENL